MKGGAQATGGIGTVGCSPLFKYSPQIPSSIMLVANNYHIVGAVSCMFMEYDPIWSKVDKNLIKKIKPYELIRNKYGTVFNKGLRKKRSTIMDLINENGGNTVPKLSSNKKVTKNSHELGEKTICSNTPNKNEKATAAAAATTEEEEIDQNIIYFLNHLKNSSTK
ncbi:Sue1p SCDLUD_002374 [Saccharomycodes ludwigii]|uniref:Sue1p n=1 Tax=Saccharomycodes ludwigii TaxID=36035 RepID=UPI001E8B681D|nr:hypothetical protein SCDLUD_002374 [Saccharomycodes ludwigii]KAH3900914.1 hypothetical protein SCDLUD_002374 [Saccharomycodes ludwigii]